MNGMDAELYELSGRVGDALKARKLMMAAAESCTGGWIGQAVTMVPGSSKWFDRGFVTYTNEAKQDMLGVSAETLKEFGAVSEQAVREMVAGALARSRAQIAVAVSGIAGPDGGSPKKPVGTVLLAWGEKGGGITARSVHFQGDRDAVRRQTVIAALEGLLARVARKS
jgi:nicotinamide-nucleotide amidase